MKYKSSSDSTNYDIHESDEKKHQFQCYCGRFFNSLRGLNTHRRSCHIVNEPSINDLFIPDELLEISNNDNETNNIDANDIIEVPEIKIKGGVKLPKKNQEWEDANLFFKSILDLSNDI